jgi:hypothetical protein
MFSAFSGRPSSPRVAALLPAGEFWMMKAMPSAGGDVGLGVAAGD